ncbi:MAG TPA: GNAT family N-acetyltransferase [Acidimicrobiales bacterium]|nr:GNAT family N-acetyltransferase [Acidimicrobiales bacterium]
MAIDVRRNDDLSRYELLVDDELAGIADYRVEGDTLVFPHTEINPRMRGRGLGEQLVRGALDDVQRRGAKVQPRCSFVKEFIQHNPEYAELAQ